MDEQIRRIRMGFVREMYIRTQAFGTREIFVIYV